MTKYRIPDLCAYRPRTRTIVMVTKVKARTFIAGLGYASEVNKYLFADSIPHAEVIDKLVNSIRCSKSFDTDEHD